MSVRLERLARRLWDGELGTAGALLSGLLAPASWLWRGVTAHRHRRLRARGPTRVEGLVVISVGNLAVGGTGKTPVASWVARTCLEASVSPALLLSGYGRDEALLHARWTPSVPVVADRDRVRAARAARAAGADVGVLDDGFQHRRLARDLDLVLLAAEDPFPGPVLPRGPYREPASALARADAVVITRRDRSANEASALVERAERVGAPVRGGIHLAPGGWTDLAGAPADGPPGDVLVVTSVARPDAVAGVVERLGHGRVELAAYRDHHDFDERDVERIVRRASGRPVVVTEKDAVKLLPWAERLAGTRVLGQEIAWEWGEDDVRALVVGAANGEART